jgi:Ca2+-binding EF-hand superfamily protein
LIFESSSQAYYRLLGPNDSRSPVKIANDLFDKMDMDNDEKVTFEEFTTVAKDDPYNESNKKKKREMNGFQITVFV